MRPGFCCSTVWHQHILRACLLNAAEANGTKTLPPRMQGKQQQSGLNANTSLFMADTWTQLDEVPPIAYAVN